ncbi:MAG: DNA mismatch repair protein MutS [Lachnospiraceae bacterium]|nr:DNA mismatch repair protein MutS [Lachnospiraceae bacterium]
MMQEYLRCKEEYKDCILLYRVGDFYEMFFDDAVTASKELELTLTGKDCGLEERAPMAGVPWHAVDTYIDRLVNKGYKAAICEQVEDPKTAKGLVKREVIRVVTPGTNLAPESLEEDRNKFLMCVVLVGERYGIAASDISTGAFFVTEVERPRVMMDEVQRYRPAELICNETLLLSGFPADELKDRQGIITQTLPARYFSEENSGEALREHFHITHIDGLGFRDGSLSAVASGALMRYLADTQKNGLPQITGISLYTTGNFMMLDTAAIRNLELTETMREKRKTGSLFGALDRTKTAMGARMLRNWIERPLIDKEAIEERLGAVEAMLGDEISRAELREYLNPVYDLERLAGRVAYHSANPRDLIALRSSLEMLPHIARLTAELGGKRLGALAEKFDDLSDICTWITDAIVEDPPLAMKEGGIIKEGYHPEVDGYRQAKSEGTQWLAQLEAREREATGIHTLKVKFNRVFGYCIEVTNSFKSMVPDRYTRKQTLTGAERYTTPELKELEDRILGAQDKLYTLEYELFADLRDRIGAEIGRLQKTAAHVAEIDALASLAEVAMRYHYVRPSLNTEGRIVIRDGRHPVVERMTPHDGFIPNDTVLNNEKKRISIITGPNMAGKSTYMRQSALIVLMAQIGSFVPAKEADIGIVDRIFTRVGASDDLASGQSTFMVEMTEVANILRNATKNSLLILDEIGRGTSTFDGLSIAWAVIEYIANPEIIGAKTLFATHYHELTELEGKIPGINNYCIAVKERGDDIVFLRKIVKGGADKSYGIQAARLAGVPEAVLSRAKEIVEQLSDADITEAVKTVTGKKGGRRKAIHYDDVDLQQMTLFDAATDEDVLRELDGIDISNLTPVEALNVLYKLQNKLKNRWKA